MHRVVICVGVGLVLASPAQAQTSQTADLLARIRALSSTPAAPVSAAPSVPQAQPAGQPATQSRSNAFNPDIGMIGNLVGAVGSSRSGSETLAPLPLVTLQESEASFQAVIDPFARADFFLAIGEEGIEVEEGFISFTTLPAGLLLKAGKMRAHFGRLNAFHNHTLPWIDRPIVMLNLLGGDATDPDTGIKDAGFSVSRLIPAGKVFVEATAELYRGDSGTIFTSSRRARRWVVGGRFDLSDRARDAAIQDRGVSGVLTFRPSEFSQIRSQYRWTRFGDGRRVARELLFQVLFTIGAHGAHVF